MGSSGEDRPFMERAKAAIRIQVLGGLCSSAVRGWMEEFFRDLSSQALDK